MSAQSNSGSNDIELLRLFKDTDDPVLTAVEVAGELGITQQAAYARLAGASENGELERKKVGSRAVVWWLPGHDVASR